MTGEVVNGGTCEHARQECAEYRALRSLSSQLEHEFKRKFIWLGFGSGAVIGVMLAITFPMLSTAEKHADRLLESTRQFERLAEQVADQKSQLTATMSKYEELQARLHDRIEAYETLETEMRRTQSDANRVRRAMEFILRLDSEVRDTRTLMYDFARHAAPGAGPAFVEEMATTLGSRHPDLQKRAAITLGILGGTSDAALAALSSEYERRSRAPLEVIVNRDQEGDVLMEMAISLGRTGRPKAIECLTQIASPESQLDPLVRNTALAGLLAVRPITGELFDDFEAILAEEDESPLLKTAVAGLEADRVSIVTFAGGVEIEDRLALYRNGLRNDNADVRAAAALSLEAMGTDANSALPDLWEAIDQERIADTRALLIAVFNYLKSPEGDLTVDPTVLPGDDHAP